MSTIVKMKAKSSFTDTILGEVVEGGFYKMSAGRADHWKKNDLGEEIAVTNKLKPVTVTQTKPKKVVVAATKKASGNGKSSGGNKGTGKGATSRK